MKTPMTLGSVLLAVGLGCVGCQTTGTHCGEFASAACCTTPAPVARIGHFVLLKLKDGADTAELIAASDEALSGIPGLTYYDSGTHLETGRDAVDSDYHVALYIGFETESDYAAYLVHPDHVAYVDAWRPRFESIRIFDVLGAKE